MSCALSVSALTSRSVVLKKTCRPSAETPAKVALFGPLPPESNSLIRIAKLKLIARAIGIRRLDLGPQGGTVLFEEKHAIDPGTVVRLIQKAPREYRLEGPLKLRVSRALPAEEARFDFAADLMKRLGAKAPGPAK